MKTKTLEDELFHIGLIFLVVGGGALCLYYFVLRHYLPEIPCFFSTFLGFYCPGCGGTRAAIALIHGQFILALWYHPLVPYSAVIGGGFMISQALHRLGVKAVKGWKYHNWYLYGFILLFVCNFLIKNLLRLAWGVTM